MSERLVKKLLIIGWDAADWMIIDQLFAAGQMPNLRRLVEHGVRADISTLEPRLSPLLWTSVATGKTADKHGILNFVEPDPNGTGLRLASSLSRKTKALWNMLTQSAMRSNVVSWYATHPAEPINGVCVSNLFATGAPGESGEQWKLPDETIHPTMTAKVLAEARVHPSQLSDDLITPLLPRLHEIDRQSELFTTLKQLVAQCMSVHNAAIWTLQNSPTWDCTMVFYDTIDTMGHHFMPFHPPRQPHISQREFDLYRNVMFSVYQIHDVLLGGLLLNAGPDVTVILLSDHGFYSDHLRPRTADLSKEQRAAVEQSWHRPTGVLVMSGPAIKQGQRVYGASLLDITPTSLTLLGLPVGSDMDGRVLTEAMEDPPTSIATLFSWDLLEGEAGLHPPDRRQDPFEAQAAIRQLADLGYLANLPEDVQAQIDLVQRESQFNLAVVHLTTGHPDRAAEEFAPLARSYPDEARYVLSLARALFMAYKFEEAAKVLREQIKRHPDSAEARLLLAGVLATIQQDAESSEHLDFVRTRHGHQPEMASAIADVCSSLRRWDDAYTQYQRVLTHDPTNTHAHTGLARAALGLERFEQAAEHALNAVEIQHVLPEAHHLLGVALTWLKDYPHAIQSFQIALSMAPGFLDAHRYLASIYRHLGDAENAAKHRVQAEKLINDRAAGKLSLEFMKREAPMGPQEWARRIGAIGGISE